MTKTSGGYVDSTVGVVGHVAQWLTTPFGQRVYKNPNFHGENGITLVFVHGTADRPCGGKRLAKGILKYAPNCVETVVLISFNHRLEGIGVETFGHQLVEKTKALGKTRVAFAGHSRGGLIAIWAAQFMGRDPENNIEIVATFPICAPLKGSYLAKRPLTWFSQSVRDIKADSPMLVYLNGEVSQRPVCPYHFVVGSLDWIVPKDGKVDAYVTSHSNSCLRIQGHGHLSIMGTEECQRYIAGVLTDLYSYQNTMEAALPAP